MDGRRKRRRFALGEEGRRGTQRALTRPTKLVIFYPSGVGEYVPTDRVKRIMANSMILTSTTQHLVIRQ